MIKFYRRNSSIVFRAEKFEPIGGSFLPDGVLCYENPYTRDLKFYIETLEGRMEVKPGDYVVTGVENEKWAIKPSIFEKTYFELEEDYQI